MYIITRAKFYGMINDLKIDLLFFVVKKYNNPSIILLYMHSYKSFYNHEQYPQYTLYIYIYTI